MNKKRVAIIGGGIFGVSCAIELSEDFDVVVFEQEDDVMSKGTFANQYRHHYGFHYPRSKETVRQCLDAQTSFRSMWNDVIIKDIPSYYAVAKEGSKVTAEEFIRFCDEMNLKYEEKYPNEDFLNRDSVDTCLLTNEPVYDIYKMKKKAKYILDKLSSTELRLSSRIIGARIDEYSEKKILKIFNNRSITEESFDYVVNATYVNQNLFKNWLGFPAKEIEFRLKEVVVVKLPTEICEAVTIMDGHFVTIVPIGHTGLYTFGDVGRSKREIKFSKGGVPWTKEYMDLMPTLFEEMKEANPYYIPIISKAEYVRSMFAVLPVLPEAKDTDERLTTVSDHGHGCWSVFEGKIVTSVKVAREVAECIRGCESGNFNASSDFKNDVCIIGGCGHIGLPLGVALANTGLKVVLLDTNEKAIENINSGIFPFKEENGSEELLKALQSGNLKTYSDPSVISECKNVITVIGTPIDEYLNPNFMGIMKMIEGYNEYFRDGQTFILRSTVYPGTSERIQKYFKEKNKNIGVSFCPERIVEGKAFEEFKNLPQIVSAFDEETFENASNLFQRLTTKSIIKSEPIEAELSKLFCNTWRYISFAVANQFFMIASEYNLDYQNIYKAMTEDYDRISDLPKPGFAAGPCLLKDTMQLAAFNNNNFFLGHAAMLVNEGLPSFVMKKVEEKCFNISNKSIGILGMAFKAENDDERDSLSFKMRKIAQTKVKDVYCNDPFIKSSEFFELEEVLNKSDIIILATPHKVYLDINHELYKDKIFVDIWNKWDKGFIFKV
jgi:UDP-N-acetyl-D-mannosaminuronic acid dehydrogenase